MENRKPEKKKLITGDTLPYLGDTLTLTVVREDRKSGRVKRVMNRLIMTVPYEADVSFRARLLDKWFRKEALAVLTEKAEEYAKFYGVSFTKIYIKDQKSCWGSCSSKGNINFNWRILLAPEPVCDYIVIHELCHRIEMNHSPEYWKLVARLCPEHRQYRKWLKDHIYELYPF